MCCLDLCSDYVSSRCLYDKMLCFNEEIYSITRNANLWNIGRQNEIMLVFEWQAVSQNVLSQCDDLENHVISAHYIWHIVMKCKFNIES